jgi:hypothetical protein
MFKQIMFKQIVSNQIVSAMVCKASAFIPNKSEAEYV